MLPPWWTSLKMSLVPWPSVRRSLYSATMARPARGRQYSSQGRSPRSSVTASTAMWKAEPKRPQAVPVTVARASHFPRARGYGRIRRSQIRQVVCSVMVRPSPVSRDS